MSDVRAAAVTLTEQELVAAHRARYDLGPGYPQLRLPPWCAGIIDSEEVRAAALAVPPDWPPARSVEVDEGLERAVRSLLCLPREASVMPTFSGSVALDRAMTAVVRLGRLRGSSKVHVITTSPSIDIMGLFLSERREIEPQFVPSRSDSAFRFALDDGELVARLDASCARHGRALHLVLLTSPENPTGEAWSREQLGAIATACRDHGAILMVDHCFLLAGVQQSLPVAVWDLSLPGLDWIGVWDTGKTIGLNEEKLGFVISGGGSLATEIRNAVNTVQFGVARRQKLSFARLFADPRFPRYLEGLREACRSNLDTLRALFDGDLRVRLRSPSAGSFAMLDCSGLAMPDEAIRSVLLREQVGVIAGRVFFHVEPVPPSLIRLALARDRDHFAASARRLREALMAR